MALKTFNLDQKIYKQFSDHCKEHGISMSKKVENFIKEEIEKISQPKKTTKQETNREHPFKKYC